MARGGTQANQDIKKDEEKKGKSRIKFGKKSDNGKSPNREIPLFLSYHKSGREEISSIHRAAFLGLYQQRCFPRSFFPFTQQARSSPC